MYLISKISTKTVFGGIEHPEKGFIVKNEVGRLFGKEEDIRLVFPNAFDSHCLEHVYDNGLLILKYKEKPFKIATLSNIDEEPAEPTTMSFLSKLGWYFF